MLTAGVVPGLKGGMAVCNLDLRLLYCGAARGRWLTAKGVYRPGILRGHLAHLEEHHGPILIARVRKPILPEREAAKSYRTRTAGEQLIATALKERGIPADWRPFDDERRALWSAERLFPGREWPNWRIACAAWWAYLEAVRLRGNREGLQKALEVRVA